VPVILVCQVMFISLPRRWETVIAKNGSGTGLFGELFAGSGLKTRIFREFFRGSSVFFCSISGELFEVLASNGSCVPSTVVSVKLLWMKLIPMRRIKTPMTTSFRGVTFLPPYLTK